MKSMFRWILTGMMCLLILSMQPIGMISNRQAADDTVVFEQSHLVNMKESPKTTGADKPNLYGQNELSTIVVLVSFSNQKIQTKPAEWHSLVFSTSGESVRQYYEKMSQGKFNIIPAKETSGAPNDGVIMVELESEHPNNGSKLVPESYTRIWEALLAADVYLDFNDYDLNKDNVLSSGELLVIAVFAGYEDLFKKDGENASSGFSHALYNNEQNRVSGVTLTEFVQIGELYHDAYIRKTDNITTYGVLAHEIGHILGLPDLYDTDYSSHGVGFFSLMGNGDKLFKAKGRMGDMPVRLDPWSLAYLGYIKPQLIQSDGVYNILANISENPVILKIPTDKESEYFLIENRYAADQDSGLSFFSTNGGILVWHIDDAIMERYFVDNIVNNDEHLKAVDLVEASEVLYGYSQLDTMNSAHKYAPYFRADGVKGVGNNSSDLMPITLHSGETLPFTLKVIEDGPLAKVEILFKK